MNLPKDALEMLMGRARGILKSLTEEPEKKDGEEEGGERPIVPDPPADDLGMTPDPRVGEEGSTSKGDMDDAAEEAGAGAPPPAPEGEAGLPGAGDGDGDETGADMDGDGDGFDEHGNHDLSEEESRALAKAYGNGTGSADPDELLDGGLDLMDILNTVLRAMEDQNVVIEALKQEVARLKSGQSAQNREIAKALASQGQPVPPVPAPAPRAITKAIPEPPAFQAPAVTADSLYADLRTGKISHDKAVELARGARGGVN